MNINQIMQKLIKERGFSYNIVSNRYANNIGYMVSLYGFEEKYPGFMMLDLPGTIMDYVNRHQTELNNPKCYLGAWIEHDVLILDVSVKHSNVRACKTFARRNKQRAIYDLKTQSSIYV